MTEGSRLESGSRPAPVPRPGTESLHSLGSAPSPLPDVPAASILETFRNLHPHRDYTVRVVTEEFTTLCPITGQPDFAQITIEYVPEGLCVESKSLKRYLASYRNVGTFHEDVVNRVLEDLASVVEPRRLRVEGRFRVRGGLSFTVTAEQGVDLQEHPS